MCKESPPLIDTNTRRHAEAFYRVVKIRLRMASIEFIPVDSHWGFWIAGTCNPRTGSEWHSAHEANNLLIAIKLS